MVSTRKAFVLGGGAVALLALGLALPRAMSHGTPASASEGAAATAAAKDPGARRVAPNRRWPVGTSFVYAVESARSLSKAGGAAPANGAASTIAGQLAVAVVEEGREDVRLRLELRAPRHHEGDGRKLDDAELTRAFYADAAPDGRLTAFWFQRGVSGPARAELKGLATDLQLVDVPAASTWTATEQDTSGEYVAEYRRRGDTLHKSKQRYVRTMGSRGLTPLQDPAAFTVSASSTDFTLAPTGWPKTVDGDETLDVTAVGLHISSRTRAKATLVAVEPAADLAALVAAEADSLEPDAPDVQGFAAARRQADEVRVGGASYTTIAGELRSGDEHVRNHAISRAAALFRLQPSAAAQAASTVLHGDLDDDGKQRLLGALGSAGTKEAQSALASVLSSTDAAASVRGDAAASLGMSPEPTEESEQALISAMASPDPKIADTAALGAGNLVKRMTDADSGDASGAVAALIAQLQQATTDDQLRLCLQALGNTGDASALPSIEQYLSYATVSVRAAAVFALRFMTGPSVDGDLTTAMGDADPLVRRAAVATLSFRPIVPVLPTVVHMLQADGDLAVRLAIVVALQLHRRDDPGVTGALQWAATHDPSPEVQKAATKALAAP